MASQLCIYFVVHINRNWIGVQSDVRRIDDYELQIAIFNSVKHPRSEQCAARFDANDLSLRGFLVHPTMAIMKFRCMFHFSSSFSSHVLSTSILPSSSTSFSCTLKYLTHIHP